jgi:HK97 gp10 family phage protein
MSQIVGMEEAIKKMKELEVATSRKIMLTALRRSARPLIKTMRNLAPKAEKNVREWWGKRLEVEPGALQRSIRAIAPKKKSERFAELLVGPTKAKAGARKTMTQKGTNRNDAWFRHFVIRGTAGYTVKKGINKGRYIPGQAAQPFVDEAYSQSGGNVSKELERSILMNINKIVNK